MKNAEPGETNHVAWMHEEGRVVLNERRKGGFGPKRSRERFVMIYSVSSFYRTDEKSWRAKEGRSGNSEARRGTARPIAATRFETDWSGLRPSPALRSPLQFTPPLRIQPKIICCRSDFPAFASHFDTHSSSRLSKKPAKFCFASPPSSASPSP